MKTLILFISIIAIIIYPFDFLKQKYETKEVIVTMHTGSTVWEIAEKYIENSPYKNMSMSEYVWNITQDNKHLFSNGRVPQAGDKIKLQIIANEE